MAGIDLWVEPRAHIEELAPHRRRNHVGPGLKHHQPAHVEQTLTGGARAAGGLLSRWVSRYQPVCEDSREYVFLVFEYPIKQRSRNVRAFRNVLERRLRKAEIEKAPTRGLQDLRSPRRCFFLCHAGRHVNIVTTYALIVNMYPKWGLRRRLASSGRGRRQSAHDPWRAGFCSVARSLLGIRRS